MVECGGRDSNPGRASPAEISSRPCLLEILSPPPLT